MPEKDSILQRFIDEHWKDKHTQRYLKDWTDNELEAGRQRTSNRARMLKEGPFPNWNRGEIEANADSTQHIQNEQTHREWNANTRDYERRKGAPKGSFGDPFPAEDDKSDPKRKWRGPK